MLFLKIASVLFLVLTLVMSIACVSLFKLKKKGWHFADIAFPCYALEFYLISDKVYYHSLLPHLCLGLALLALAITGLLLFKKREFTYPRFLKLFWRSGFLVTFVYYLALTIAVLAH